MQLLDIIPDVINPMDGLYGRAKYGAMHRFVFSSRSGFTGARVEKLLQKYGIRIWGREMRSETQRAFLVKRKQAAWAEYLLCRAGVPLLTPLLNPRNQSKGTMPKAWGDGVGPQSFVDHVVNTIMKITGAVLL